MRGFRDRVLRAVLTAVVRWAVRGIEGLRGRRGRDFIGPELDRIDRSAGDSKSAQIWSARMFRSPRNPR